MPVVKSLREYFYYCDDDTDFGDSPFEEIEAMRLNKVPPYKPVETLAPVMKALQNLPKDVAFNDDASATSEITEEKAQGDISTEPKQFFAEGTYSPSEIKVTVENVGELEFPLGEETVQKLIAVSTKEKFGSRTEELLDTKDRNTQMIPASELKVNIKEETMNEIMKKTSESLNINEKCSLKLHLYNMLIYGEEQFFDWHKDTEKVDNMTAKLVIVLPSNHDGGDLHIKHGVHSHSFNSSENIDSVKWVAFYSDCGNKVYQVSKGYQVVLTYNVELQYPTDPEPLVASDPDLTLNNAVAEHFSHNNNATRLLVFLVHSYSENSLKWHMIKGRDRTYAQALLSVAKSQDLTPYLVLAKCLEVWEASDFHGPVRNDAFVDLHYWVDEHNVKVEKYLKLDYIAMAKEVCTFRNEFWSLAEPDKEEQLGWYGNGPAIREQWYFKACVVLEKN